MDEVLKSDLAEHENVPSDAAKQVTQLAAGGITPGRMPAMYLGHGAPPLVDDPLWTTQLAAWAQALPKPTAILVVSAHWEAAPLTLGATNEAVPLLYDFWGFPSAITPRPIRHLVLPRWPSRFAGCSKGPSPLPMLPTEGSTTAPTFR
jgi:hypothetical protein